MSVWGIFNFFLWAYPLHWVNSLIFHIRGTCHFQCSWVVDAWIWVQWVLNSQLAGLTPGQSIMFSSETHMNRFWENFTNTCLLIYEAATLFIISSYSIRLCLGSIDWRIGEGFFFLSLFGYVRWRIHHYSWRCFQCSVSYVFNIHVFVFSIPDQALFPLLQLKSVAIWCPRYLIEFCPSNCCRKISLGRVHGATIDSEKKFKKV